MSRANFVMHTLAVLLVGWVILLNAATDCNVVQCCANPLR